MWTQNEHPDNHKVADIATAAGRVWREMPFQQKTAYEELSSKAKVRPCAGWMSMALQACTLCCICIDLWDKNCIHDFAHAFCSAQRTAERAVQMQADYVVSRDEFYKTHPKPQRKPLQHAQAPQLVQPPSAFSFFLIDFRVAFQVVRS